MVKDIKKRTIANYFSEKMSLLTYSYSLIVFIFTYSLGKGLVGYPIFRFLTERGRFDDFFNSISLAPHLPAIDNAYLLSVFLLCIFQHLHGLNPSYLFAAYHILIILIFIFAYYHKEQKYLYHLPIFLISYPMIFAISRGNAELLAFSLTFAGIVFFQNNRHFFSLFFLLLAATVKPTAAIFLIFLLLNFRVKHLILYALFGIINIVSFLLIKGDYFFKIISTKQMASNYFNGYVIGDGGTLFNNSFYGLIKFILLYLNSAPEYIAIAARLYQNLFPFILILLLGAYFLIQKRKLWRDLAIMANALCLFMPVSADYRLLYFLLPLLFIEEQDLYDTRNYIVLILIFLSIIPKHFVFYHLTPLNIAVTSQTFLNPILEMLLCISLFDSHQRRHYWCFKAYPSKAPSIVGSNSSISEKL